jgi:hypothetical protein
LQRRLGAGSTRAEDLLAKIRAQEAQLAVKDGALEQQKASFERELRQREESHAQHWAGLQAEIETARACHVEQHERTCRENQTELDGQARDMEALRVQLKADQAAHAKETRDLHDQLAEHSHALHTARKIIEGLRADAERAAETKRKDAALMAAIDRNQRLYHLETGLVAQHRSALHACYSTFG